MWKTLTRKQSTLTIRNASPSPERRLGLGLGSEADSSSTPPLSRAATPTPTLISPSSSSSSSSSFVVGSNGRSTTPTPTTPSTTTTTTTTTTSSTTQSANHRVVPLVDISTVAAPDGATKYVPLGVSKDAEKVLSCLKAPISIVVFAGFGRSGKSRTASRMAQMLEHWPNLNNLDAAVAEAPLFASKPGNIPCTHGIDMAVVPHPDPNKGHVLLLDCEGASNHNQTAIPFVMGLAARLASRIFVFERACFTTAGLESVMQIVNMGLATLPIQDDEDSYTPQRDLTRSLVLIENMSINSGIPSPHLLTDLLSSTDGDEMSNRVKRLIREQFDVSFAKLPFVSSSGNSEFDEACESMVGDLVDGLKKFEVGGVAADGPLLVQLCNELLTQIRDGGSRFNMVSATESLVANMATEAANTVWSDFLTRARSTHNTPAQINGGRKHLRTTLRELEGFANMALIDLETFTSRLRPQEPASIARIIWDRNYDAFIEDVKAAHGSTQVQVVEQGVWAVRLNRFVVDMVEQFVEAMRQLVRLARFGSMLVMLTNYYFWKHGIHVIRNVAQNVVAEMVD